MAPGNAFPEGDSPYGVYNMISNAKEWVQDMFTKYSNLEHRTINSVGLKESNEELKIRTKREFIVSQRVFRGGGWYDRLGYASTATYGNVYSGELGFSGLGFRVAEKKQDNRATKDFPKTITMAAYE